MIVIRNRRLRQGLRIVIPFILIPAVVAIGVFLFDEKRYAFISLVITVLALLLFAAGFEKKKTGARRLVAAAVMTALSVVGRFIPFLKPVTALTVLTGIWLGGESGFLVGALSAVISNFYFGQGPWTPFQMFAWGMLGLIAGFLSRPLQKYRAALIAYGALAGVVYSFIMDIWTVLWYQREFVLSLYITALGTAVPYMILYSVSNVIFLCLFAKPFGEKLSRIRIKYGV